MKSREEMISDARKVRRGVGIAVAAVRRIFRTGVAWGRTRQAVRDTARGRGKRPDPATIAAAGGAGLAGGAAGAYFLDPNSGKRRRHVARDRVAGFLRGRARQARRGAAYVGGTAAGKAKAAATPSRGPERLNDPALTAKVESELFRAAETPQGEVNVNVEDGIVYLRGELGSSEEIEKLTGDARSIEGVRDVVSLLHLPGEPAPTNGGRRAAA